MNLMATYQTKTMKPLRDVTKSFNSSSATTFHEQYERADKPRQKIKTQAVELEKPRWAIAYAEI